MSRNFFIFVYIFFLCRVRILKHSLKKDLQIPTKPAEIEILTKKFALFYTSPYNLLRVQGFYYPGPTNKNR
jgi:hypothetical protein